MPNPRITFTKTILVLASLLATPACVYIHNVDDEQMPSTWKAGIAAVSSFRDPSGQYRSDGEAVNSKGTVDPVRLASVFFPGRFARRQVIESVELKFNPVGQLTAIARSGGSTLAEGTWPAELDRKTGWISVAALAVKDNNKFGAAAATQSVRLALSPDGALYAKVRNTAAGIILFLPTASTNSVWGRFEPLPAATPGAR